MKRCGVHRQLRMRTASSQGGSRARVVDVRARITLSDLRPGMAVEDVSGAGGGYRNQHFILLWFQYTRRSAHTTTTTTRGFTHVLLMILHSHSHAHPTAIERDTHNTTEQTIRN